MKPSDPDYRSDSNLYSSLFGAVAFASFAFYSAIITLYGYLTEKLTRRLRKAVFEKFLRMEMKWHDNPENAPGVLTSILARDTTNVSYLTSSTLPLLI